MDTVVADALADFQGAADTGPWTRLSKSRLIADLRSKCDRPMSVNQKSSPLCGPAAIVYELVTRDKLSYVQTCRTLYETGELVGTSSRVRPSDTLLESRVGAGMSIADWMLMTTMRDTENALFAVDADSGQVAMGISTPWEMKGWARELLGYDNVDYVSTYMWGELDAIKRAQAVRDAGGVAFLMVTAELVENKTPTIGYPDHWVSYLGGFGFTEGVWYRWDSSRVSFNVYSWAGRWPIDAPEGNFEDCLWGVVFAEL